MLKKGKLIAYILWGIILLCLIIAYFINPEIASPKYIVSFIREFKNEMLLIYIILTFVRGFFLIPSTPFVIGGGLLFPDNLFLVLVISMMGVMLSATTLYYFSDMLGFSKYLKKKFPDKIELWKSRLNSPKSTLFITAWAFFPFVPTDLICYVSGIIKIPFKNMFIGVFIGELVLDIFYVYFGANLFEMML